MEKKEAELGECSSLLSGEEDKELLTAAPTCTCSSQPPSSEDSRACSQLQEEEEDKAEQPGDLLSHLSQFLYQKLGLGNDEEPVHILDEPSIDGIVRYIQGGKCKNIIAMIGAGISTAAGIPDFRSPNSGIYSKLGKFNLPSPEAIFEIGYFRRNPAPFYALARQLFPQDLKPTLSHYFLRLLHEKGLLLRLYTQNIDCLERLAGIPAEAIVEAHGTFHSSHCLSCNHEYSLDWLREQIAAEPVPLCLDCGCPVKPDIVFFGERLPDRFFDLSEESLSSGNMPSDWKVGRVIPVYKTEPYITAAARISHRTSHPLQVARPRARTTTFAASFFFRTATDWNGLPANIANTTCPSSFTELVTDHFVK
ncbi:sirtuin 2 isoform X4 [Dermacentor variabilis]|uniref:sirtuin 2 isoform X4 n=1 Tax=Dermacentor variabilis TaxID=34621 RepID=UPI003F5B7DBB